VIDLETRTLMETPRCGVKDIIGHGAYARRRKRWEATCETFLTFLSGRYVLQGSRWRVSELTYRVTKYPSTTRLKKDEVSTFTSS
jgi:matrix metalloproteinase-14 (membrane-inserted)